MAHRTTTPVQRVDLLLVQAERFAELTANEEAIARARQVMAYAELERARTTDPHLTAALEMRGRVAEALIARLTERPARVEVHAEDAAVPESWS